MDSNELKPKTALNPALRIIRHHEVAARLGLSQSKIFSMVSEGVFPKPFRIVPNGRATGWLASDVEAWIVSRRDAAIKHSDLI